MTKLIIFLVMAIITLISMLICQNKLLKKERIKTDKDIKDIKDKYIKKLKIINELKEGIDNVKNKDISYNIDDLIGEINGEQSAH